MLRYRYFLLLLIGLSVSSLYSQVNNYRWRLRLGTGAMNYVGDVSYRWQTDWQSYQALDQDALPWGVTLGLERRLNPTFALGFSGQYGYITANDRLTDANGTLLTENPNFARALNFRSEVSGGQMTLHVRSDNGWLLRRESRLAPYLFAGLGATSWQVFGDLFAGEGEEQRYYYWSDQTIRSLPQSDPQADQAVILTQDQQFETQLDTRETEVDGRYETLVFHIPVGLGIDFRLTKRARIGLQYQLNYTFTDYLDDVSGAYRQDIDDPTSLLAYAGNPSGQPLSPGQLRGDDQPNDWYGLLSLNLSVDFGLRLSEYNPVYFYAQDRDAAQWPEVAREIDSLALLAGYDIDPRIAVDSGAAMAVDTSSLSATEPQDSSQLAQQDSTSAIPVATRPDSAARQVIYQTYNYYYFNEPGPDSDQIRSDTVPMVSPDSTVAEEVPPADTMLVQGEDSIRKDTVVESLAEAERVASDSVGEVPADSTEGVVGDTVVSEPMLRDSLTDVMDAVTIADTSQAKIDSLKEKVEALEAALARRVREDSIAAQQALALDSAAQGNVMIDSTLVEALNQVDTVLVPVLSTEDSMRMVDMELQIRALQDSLAIRQAQPAASTPDTALVAVPVEARNDSAEAAMQREIQQLQDSLARVQAKVVKQPATTPRSADSDSLGMYRDLVRRQEARAELQAIKDSIDQAEDAVRQAETEARFRSLQQQINELQAGTEDPQGMSPAESAYRPVDPAVSKELNDMNAEIRALRREVARERQGNDPQPQEPLRNTSRDGNLETALRIARLELELERMRNAQATASPVPTPAPAPIAPPIDTTAIDSASVIDSTQAPTDPGSSGMQGVEFDYQRVEPETAPKPDTVRVVVVQQPDTIRMIQRDTVQVAETLTQKQMLIGTSRVNVFFPMGASKLYESDYTVLDGVVEDLVRFPNLKTRVKGYADQIGSAPTNERLSRERAEMVATYLVSQGISADRIETQHFGENQPRYGNGSLDRRVEVELYVEE